VLQKMLGGDAASPASPDAQILASAMPLRIPPPTPSRRFEPRNRLLSLLPARDLARLAPHLETVPLARGSVLCETDEPLTRLYFVESGLAALLASFENRAIGVAAVGREGAVDIQGLLLGGATAVAQCQVLVPGSALALDVSAFRSALRDSRKLRAACEACVMGLFVQMLQAVPCTRLHSLEQQCARWLLMCADRMEEDTFELARDSLADMLGVPQSTLAVVVHKLEDAGLICSNPSAVTLVDRQRLETAACECYRIVSAVAGAPAQGRRDRRE
jgi:CRP-like cAMP-binding protein